MKKKTGSKSRMTKNVAGKRGVLATAKRSGSSKAMKATRGKANPQQVNDLLKRKLTG